MKLYTEAICFDDFTPWAGAVDTVNTLRKHNKLEEAWQYIEDILIDSEYVSETELNDLLWFEPEIIYEAVGLTEDGEEPDKDEEDEDEELDEDDEDEDEEGE